MGLYSNVIRRETAAAHHAFVHGLDPNQETKVKPCWGRWLRGFEFKIFISFLLDFHTNVELGSVSL
eukprot:scaffold231683_cov92-Attheya_sp.AAC.2